MRAIERAAQEALSHEPGNFKRLATQVSRRQVMVGAAGLTFAHRACRPRRRLGAASARTGKELSPWVSIAPDGTISIMSPATEMGQGSIPPCR